MHNLPFLHGEYFCQECRNVLRSANLCIVWGRKVTTKIQDKLSIDIKDVLGNSHTYTDREYHGVDNSWTEKNQAEEGERVYYGDFDRYPLFAFPENPPKYYLPELMTGSDYSGGTVTKSNHRVFLEKFKEIDGVHDVYGGYDTYSVAIREDCINDDMIEIFEGLNGYPLIDEEDMSELESEIEMESWVSWIKGDFLRKLHKEFDEEDSNTISDMIDDISDDDLWELFRNKMEETNTYFQHEEGCNCSVNIERIMEAITMEEGKLK